MEKIKKLLKKSLLLRGKKTEIEREWKKERELDMLRKFKNKKITICFLQVDRMKL